MEYPISPINFVESQRTSFLLYIADLLGSGNAWFMPAHDVCVHVEGRESPGTPQCDRSKNLHIYTKLAESSRLER